MKRMEVIDMTETARSMIEKLNEKIASTPELAGKINTIYQFMVGIPYGKAN